MSTLQFMQATDILSDRIQTELGFKAGDAFVEMVLELLYSQEAVDDYLEAANLDMDKVRGAISMKGPYYVNLTNKDVFIESEVIGNLSIRPSGVIASATIDEGEFDAMGIRVAKYGDVEGLPEPVEGVYFVVTPTTINAVVGRLDVIAPVVKGHGVARNDRNRVVASPGFFRIER